MPQLKKEHAHTINGVEGKMSEVLSRPDGVIDKQVWKGKGRNSRYEHGATLYPEIRFDDSCRNGYMNFGFTATAYVGGRDVAGGCMHEEIAKVFPELEPLIKWHLMGTKGPMHYLDNTIYHASDRDDSRYPVGAPCSWEEFMFIGNSPLPVTVKPKFKAWLKEVIEFNADLLAANPKAATTIPNYVNFEVVSIAHVNRPGERYGFDPHYSFKGFGETWYDCPFSTKQEAEAFAEAMRTNNTNPGFVRFEQRVTGYAKSKERWLDFARSAAVWPEATDEQLCLPEPELRALLEARAPALQAAFKADMEAAGFLWSEKAVVAA